MQLKKSVFASVILAALLASPSRANELQELESLRATTLSLVEALVEQGVLTREKADLLIAKAKSAGNGVSQVAGAGSSPANEAGTIRVPYVPKFVRDEITDQVRKDVMAQARKEGWAAPDALPDWLGRFTFSGDIRVRHENDRFRQPCSATVVANCNFDAVTYNAITLSSLANTTQDRTVNSLRARLAVDAKISDSVSAGILLSTGSLSSPVSTKQVLGNSLNREQFSLDRGFLTYAPANMLRFTAGRFANPFLSTDMLWSENLNFDGASATLRPVLSPSTNFFLTAGGFPIGDTEPTLTNSAKNKWLYALQLGANWKNDAGNGLQFGVALYDYRNVEGIPNDAVQGAVAYNATAPGFAQKGNSLFNINYAVPPSTSGVPAATLPGLLSKFRELDYTVKAKLGNLNGFELVATADYVRNLGFDINEIQRRTGLIPLEPATASALGGAATPQMLEAKTRGYQFKLGVGKQELTARNDWRVDAGYRHLERDAVLDAFNDSDWHTGGTDYRGYFLAGYYALDKGLTIGARYFTGDPISGPPLAIDVLQLDLIARF